MTVREKIETVEVDQLGSGIITETLTSVYIHEIVIIGGTEIEVYEGVLYLESFKHPFFRRFQ